MQEHHPHDKPSTYNLLKHPWAWFVLATLCRVLPHPANITPLTCSTLFAAQHSRSPVAIGGVWASMVITDMLLAWLWQWPLWGTWSLFTYSGYALMVVISQYLHTRFTWRMPQTILCCSIFYWGWSNLSAFYFSGIYAQTLAGFVACYSAALPFLKSALIGNALWGILIFKGYDRVKSYLTVVGPEVVKGA